MYFCESVGQYIGVDTAYALQTLYFWVIFYGLQWALMMFTVFDVFASYSSALQAFLARVQDFTLIVIRYKFTALKVNGITEDILLYISKPKTRYSFLTQKGHKIKRDYLSTQEVLKYPLEYASIFLLRKLYLAHLTNSTKCDFLALVQFDLVYTYFYSR